MQTLYRDLIKKARAHAQMGPHSQMDIHLPWDELKPYVSLFANGEGPTGEVKHHGPNGTVARFYADEVLDALLYMQSNNKVVHL